MVGSFRGLIALAAAATLSACVLQGPSKPAAPNPVTGGEIEVTELGAAPAAVAPAVAAAAAGAASPPAAPAAPAGKPATAPEAAADAAPAVPAPTAAPAVPEVQKSAAQLACEDKKGVWAKAGKGGHSCVTFTKDSGKACRRKGDCDSQCLARSGTCAPHKPLFGCNEILDDMGRRTTLCLD